MRLLQRSARPVQQEQPPVQPVDPLGDRCELTQVGDRTDLTCLTCRRVIAYGVCTQRLQEDVAFFLEQHTASCCRSIRGTVPARTA